MWFRGINVDVRKSRLQIDRAKFAPHLMVSARVCYGEGECQILRGEFASKSCRSL